MPIPAFLQEEDASKLKTESAGDGRAERALSPDAPPEVVLMQVMIGSLVSQALYVAAKLGIADLLADGPKDARELAEATDVQPHALYRILRVLASYGIFSERPDGAFQLTPSAELLRSGVYGSMRDTAIFMGEEWHWRVWGNTLHSVKTGRAAWEHTHGLEVFPYFAEHKAESEIFNRAMTSMSQMAAVAVVDAYDFSGVEKLVDVAGGHGSLLASILRSSPQTRGVLFDLPHVIEGARESVKAEGVAERVELVSGDFFEAVPEGADAYIMKHIIHDWDDERALRILKNINRAMRRDGRVLLVEMVVAPGNQPDLGKVLDIEMLVSPGGQERTEDEYRTLFARAGLRLTRIVPTKSPFSVVEAVKEETPV